METIPEATGHHRSGGWRGWTGGLPFEEMRVHRVLTEVREGLDAARLAEATGIAKIDIYRVLEALRLRGMVETYPGSPVLFYASVTGGEGGPAVHPPLRPQARPPSPGRGTTPWPQAGDGERGPPAPPLSGASRLPSRTSAPPPALPEERPEGLYLVWESRPQRSLASYRSLVRRGSPGLLLSRSPSAPEPGSRVTLGETGPPPRAERLDEVVRAVRQAGPRAAVLLDGLEYLVSRHGFDSVLRMVYRLRELAAAHQAVLLIPADPRALEPRQKALLEREARVLGSGP